MFRFVVLTALLACAAADVVPLLDGRIVGGKATTIQSYPHQISLRYSGSHICGGSLYKANVVVTAAHCVQGTSASVLSVVAGTSSRTSGGTSIKVSQVKVHPSYSSSTMSNDVAVLILASSFTLSSSIQLIALTSSAPAAGSVVTVTGWGTTSEGGSAASTLQVVDVNVVSSATCNSKYGSGSITSSMLCAGVDAGGKDACQGDSGGPLIQSGKLVGIVSWGYGCARAQYPGVYSNVAALKSWIEANS
ncbi:trypsin delta-like [Hermetia illucens]|uniref:trypsin delta-like n=1 Tax=Hermetia illucens TaxID=343691 RepID=UPI0018CC444A|nr:trypsin delta-like [Hermetia illucens]XP_037916203.1 trypsin delta-like [Hermetia illucens]